MKTVISIEIDTDNLFHQTDEHVAQLWHVTQANPAPHGDLEAGQLAEYVGREIIRRCGRTKAKIIFARRLLPSRRRTWGKPLRRPAAMFERSRLKLAALAIALHAGPVAAFDAWTDAQTTKATALAVLHVANWGQHRAMAYNDAAPAIDGIKSIRPGQASRPSASAVDPDYGRVDRRFVLSAVAGAAVLAALPSAWRDDALNAGLVIEAGMVGRQLQLGVGWRF